MLTIPPAAPNRRRSTITTRLLLARHGETEWNRQGRWQGQADLALNERGRQQAMALAASLKNEPLAAVYSSTLRRAVETAQAVAAQHRLNVCRDERLMEINLGEWEGLLYQQIAAQYPDLLRQWEADPRSVRPPKGESIQELEERVLAVLEEIAQAYRAETVCLIGHKVTNGIIRSHYLGLPLVEALRGEPAHAACEVIELPYSFIPSPYPHSILR